MLSYVYTYIIPYAYVCMYKYVYIYLSINYIYRLAIYILCTHKFACAKI